MGIYYKIWVDCILGMKSQKKYKNSWRRESKISMNIPMMANIFIVVGVLQRYIFGHIYKIRFSYLPLEVNAIISFFILYLFPVMLVNYLLIWRDDKYKKLIEKYPYDEDSILWVVYFIISLFLPVLWILGVAFEIIP